MSTTKSMDLERPPLRSTNVDAGPVPSLFLPEVGPTVPRVMMSSPSTVDNSVENSDSSSESSESSTDSEEEEEDREWSGAKGEGVENGTRRSLLGKRKTNHPVKYSAEFPAGSTGQKKRTRQKKTVDKPIPPESNPSDSTPVDSLKRGRSCGKCDGCLREDCAKCQFCLDKPKFGGPGKKKQRCEKRPCSNFRKKGYSSSSNFQRLPEKMKMVGASVEVKTTPVEKVSDH